MKLVVTNRTEVGVECVLQAEDVQMPMWGDPGLRKVFQSLIHSRRPTANVCRTVYITKVTPNHSAMLSHNFVKQSVTMF